VIDAGVEVVRYSTSEKASILTRRSTNAMRLAMEDAGLGVATLAVVADR